MKSTDNNNSQIEIGVIGGNLHQSGVDIDTRIVLNPYADRIVENQEFDPNNKYRFLHLDSVADSMPDKIKAYDDAMLQQDLEAKEAARQKVYKDAEKELHSIIRSHHIAENPDYASYASKESLERHIERITDKHNTLIANFRAESDAIQQQASSVTNDMEFEALFSKNGEIVSHIEEQEARHKETMERLDKVRKLFDLEESYVQSKMRLWEISDQPPNVRDANTANVSAEYPEFEGLKQIQALDKKTIRDLGQIEKQQVYTPPIIEPEVRKEIEFQKTIAEQHKELDLARSIIADAKDIRRTMRESETIANEEQAKALRVDSYKMTLELKRTWEKASPEVQAATAADINRTIGVVNRGLNRTEDAAEISDAGTRFVGFLGAINPLAKNAGDELQKKFTEYKALSMTDREAVLPDLKAIYTEYKLSNIDKHVNPTGYQATIDAWDSVPKRFTHEVTISVEPLKMEMDESTKTFVKTTHERLEELKNNPDLTWSQLVSETKRFYGDDSGTLAQQALVYGDYMDLIRTYQYNHPRSNRAIELEETFQQKYMDALVPEQKPGELKPKTEYAMQIRHDMDVSRDLILTANQINSELSEIKSREHLRDEVKALVSLYNDMNETQKLYCRGFIADVVDKYNSHYLDKVTAPDVDSSALDEALAYRTKITSARTYETYEKVYEGYQALPVETKLYLAETMATKTEGFYHSAEQKVDMTIKADVNNTLETISVDKIVSPYIVEGHVVGTDRQVTVVMDNVINYDAPQNNSELFNRTTGVTHINTNRFFDENVTFSQDDNKQITMTLPASKDGLYGPSYDVGNHLINHDFHVLDLHAAENGKLIVVARDNESNETFQFKTGVDYSKLPAFEAHLSHTANGVSTTDTKPIRTEDAQILVDNLNYYGRTFSFMERYRDDTLKADGEPKVVTSVKVEDNGRTVIADGKKYELLAYRNDEEHDVCIAKVKSGNKISYLQTERSLEYEYAFESAAMIAINNPDAKRMDSIQESIAITFDEKTKTSFANITINEPDGFESEWTYRILQIRDNIVVNGEDGKPHSHGQVLAEDANGDLFVITTAATKEQLIQQYMESVVASELQHHDKVTLPTFSLEDKQVSFVGTGDDLGIRITGGKNYIAGDVLTIQDNVVLFQTDLRTYKVVLNEEQMKTLEQTPGVTTRMEDGTIKSGGDIIDVPKNVLAPVSMSRDEAMSMQTSFETHGNNLVVTTSHESSVHSERVDYLHADLIGDKINVTFVEKNGPNASTYIIEGLSQDDFRTMFQNLKIHEETLSAEQHNALKNLNAGTFTVDDVRNVVNAINETQTPGFEIASPKRTEGNLYLANVRETEDRKMLLAEDHTGAAVTIKDPVFYHEKGEMFVSYMQGGDMVTNRIASTAFGKYDTISSEFDWARVIENNENSIYSKAMLLKSVDVDFQDAKTFKDAFTERYGISCECPSGYVNPASKIDLHDVKVIPDLGVFITKEGDKTSFTYFNPEVDSNIFSNSTMKGLATKNGYLQLHEIPQTHEEAKLNGFKLVDYDNGVAVRSNGFVYRIKQSDIDDVFASIKKPDNYFDAKTVCAFEDISKNQAQFVSSERFNGNTNDTLPSVNGWSISVDSHNKPVLKFEEASVATSLSNIGQERNIKNLSLASDGKTLLATIEGTIGHDNNTSGNVSTIRLCMPTDEQITTMQDKTAKVAGDIESKMRHYCHQINDLTREGDFANESSHHMTLRKGSFVAVQFNDNEPAILYKVANAKGDMIMMGGTDNEQRHPTVLTQEDLAGKKATALEFEHQSMGFLRMHEGPVRVEIHKDENDRIISATVGDTVRIAGMGERVSGPVLACRDGEELDIQPEKDDALTK